MFSVFLILIAVVIGTLIGFANPLLIITGIIAIIGIFLLLMWKSNVIIPEIVILLTILFKMFLKTKELRWNREFF